MTITFLGKKKGENFKEATISIKKEDYSQLTEGFFDDYIKQGREKLENNLELVLIWENRTLVKGDNITADFLMKQLNKLI